jgi:hypothetical protein
VNNRGARWYSVAVLSDGAELVSAQDAIVLLGRRRPGRRRRLGRQRVFGQLGTAGQIRWCAGITEATRPCDRKWGVAAWAMAGTKPIAAVSALFFAGAADFFTGQGDRNTKKCHLLLPHAPARRQKRLRRRGEDLGRGDKNATIHGFRPTLHVLLPTSSAISLLPERVTECPSPPGGGLRWVKRNWKFPPPAVIHHPLSAMRCHIYLL